MTSTSSTSTSSSKIIPNHPKKQPLLSTTGIVYGEVLRLLTSILGFKWVVEDDEEGPSIYLDDDDDGLGTASGVAAEIEGYRRISIVHTREVNYFMEIGCNFDVIVDSVDCHLRVGSDKS